MTFYSLVIQSIVRQSLLKLAIHPPNIKHYLHLAVRFFVASSGKFDPLALETNSSELDPLEQRNEEEYEAAKIAVGHKNWEALGIKNSRMYLQRLFEDNGEPIESKQVDKADHVTSIITRQLDYNSRFGHEQLPHDRFEKAYYKKHPDLFKKELGQYREGRPEWALSSDDLNKIVRDTASRGAGPGKDHSRVFYT